LKIEANNARKFTPFDIAVTGLMIALVYVFTLIRVPLPGSLYGGGLMHFGTVPLVFASIRFGRRKGALAGAFGMGLFDLTMGYAVWAPFTFVIRGVMGWLVGWIAGGKTEKPLLWNSLAIFIGGVWMTLGYYLAQCILYMNWISGLYDMIGDAIQVLSALLLTLPLLALTQRVWKTK